MLKKILIANRGEIACRVMRTAKRLGIGTVAVYSAADRQAMHVHMADEAVFLGPPPASRSYLLGDKIIEAAKACGADAIHPGYGFLSENMNFAEAVEQAGIIFIGPNCKAIQLMGDKIISKKCAADAGVSIIPGFQDAIAEEEQALVVAKEIGFPVMIKAAAGGGGKGMRVARDEKDLREGFSAAGREAKASFGDDRVFIEKFIESPRHIEIQVLCDKHGNGVYLWERECSIQRRNQKVIEEAPSVFLTDDIRQKMGAEALTLAAVVNYDSAGTVEFVMAPDQNFYFLEMNTRLQVEHPVTEMITGIDLVEEMIRIASGEKLRYQQSDIKRDGWAMEARLYSEDPANNFMPSTGRLSWFRPPARTKGVDFRLDSGVEEGDMISMFYDPMIAKLITHAPTREEAIEKISMTLDGFRLEGVRHNLSFLNAVFNHPNFLSGDINTGFIDQTWPDGFTGAALDAKEQKFCLAVALYVHKKVRQRALQLEGRRFAVNESAPVIRVCNGEHTEVVKVESHWQGDNCLQVDFGGDVFAVESLDWRLGDIVWTGKVSGKDRVMQLRYSAGGILLSYRGAQLDIHLRTQFSEDIASQLPERRDQINQTELLCPMPGQITQINVKEGDQVGVGQALLIIEAMKMENTLRAENKTVIKKIFCQEGESVGFQDLLMEFEIPQEN